MNGINKDTIRLLQSDRFVVVANENAALRPIFRDEFGEKLRFVRQGKFAVRSNANRGRC